VVRVKPVTRDADVLIMMLGKDEEVMDLLAQHVPLSLIMDLAMPDGPHSTELLAHEPQPGDPWWEPAAAD
jgi:hypothetical protein